MGSRPSAGYCREGLSASFEKLVAFFQARPVESFDPELLAERTLDLVAQEVYRRLTGLQPKDLCRFGIHHVPSAIAPDVRAAARIGLLAASGERGFSLTDRVTARRMGLLVEPLYYAKRVLTNARSEQHRRTQIPPRGVVSEVPFDLEKNLIDQERFQLLKRALAELPSDDRRFIEQYYALPDEGTGRSRNDLGRDLGLTPGALRIRATRIRQRLSKSMTAAQAPVQAQFTACYPTCIDPRNWHTLLAYMHVEDALPVVQSDSKRRLSGGEGRT